MTNERYLDLNSIDPPVLSAEEIKEGWHYCYDFDGLLVGPGMGELKSCGCLPQDHSCRQIPEDV